MRFARVHALLLVLSWCSIDGASPTRSEATDRLSMGQLSRRQRHLLFPDPKGSETKVQVLFGLGLPMEEDVSMTLGYVLKCNYNLPYNSSDLTEVRARFRKSTEHGLPDGTKPTYAGTTRWSLYRILESVMDRLNGAGKACMMRAVCESASASFDEGHGLLGELLHVLLTPSTTQEEFEIYSDREYRSAEAIGKNSPGKCGYVYPECQYNPLDYFTRTMAMEAMEKR